MHQNISANYKIIINEQDRLNNENPRPFKANNDRVCKFH